MRRSAALTDDVVAKIRKHLKAELPAGELPVADAVTRVVPAIRMVLSEKGKAKVASVRNSALISHFLLPANREKVSLPFLPDHIVYCKSAPLFLGAQGAAADPEALLAQLPAQLEAYRKKWGYSPKIILADGIGMIGVEDSKRSVDTALDVFEDLMKVSFLSDSFGGPRFLSAQNIAFIDAWEVENYRRAVAAASARQGRVQARIAVVTGAAQGFGRGIAEGLFREGANVVIADLNEKAGRALADELNSSSTASNAAVFAAADVTKPASMDGLAQAVRGGLRGDRPRGEQRGRAAGRQPGGDHPRDLRLRDPGELLGLLPVREAPLAGDEAAAQVRPDLDDRHRAGELEVWAGGQQ